MIVNDDPSLMIVNITVKKKKIKSDRFLKNNPIKTVANRFYKISSTKGLWSVNNINFLPNNNENDRERSRLQTSIWFLERITSWSRWPEEPRSRLILDARLFQNKNWRHLLTKVSERRGEGAEQELEHLSGHIWQLQWTASSLGSRSGSKAYLWELLLEDEGGQFLYEKSRDSVETNFRCINESDNYFRQKNHVGVTKCSDQ